MKKYIIFLLCVTAFTLSDLEAQEVDANFPVNEKWYRAIYVASREPGLENSELPKIIQFKKKMGGSWYIAINKEDTEFYINLDNITILKESSPGDE